MKTIIQVLEELSDNDIPEQTAILKEWIEEIMKEIGDIQILNEETVLVIKKQMQ